MSTIAGLIDGFGSFITAMSMIIIPNVKGGLFYLFAISSFCSGLFLTPMAYREFKEKLKGRK